jgi:hypothetical protein
MKYAYAIAGGEPKTGKVDDMVADLHSLHQWEISKEEYINYLYDRYKANTGQNMARVGENEELFALQLQELGDIKVMPILNMEDDEDGSK